MEVKVHVVSDCNLDTTVEGLEQHSASALFYMFDEIHRSGFRKLTMFPHCVNLRRVRNMFLQFDSEDNDNVPVLPRSITK